MRRCRFFHFHRVYQNSVLIVTLNDKTKYSQTTNRLAVINIRPCLTSCHCFIPYAFSICNLSVPSSTINQVFSNKYVLVIVACNVRNIQPRNQEKWVKCPSNRIVLYQITITMKSILGSCGCGDNRCSLSTINRGSGVARASAGTSIHINALDLEYLNNVRRSDLQLPGYSFTYQFS